MKIICENRGLKSLYSIGFEVLILENKSWITIAIGIDN
jgi:hypothetical protein